MAKLKSKYTAPFTLLKTQIQIRQATYKLLLLDDNPRERGN